MYLLNKLCEIFMLINIFGNTFSKVVLKKNLFIEKNRVEKR